jgi:hypothetical protein
MSGLVFNRCNQLWIEQQGGMTTDAVLMHHLATCLVDKNNLRLPPQGKYRSMAQSILGLEKIMAENIRMRHMAVVAVGMGTMRTVVPGGILRGHNVAVDAGFRFI